MNPLLLTLCLLPQAQRETATASPALADPTPRLSAEAARGDLMLLRKALEEIHPGTHRFATRPELDGAFEALAASLAEGIGTGTFYREISLLCARLRCGHTRVEAPPILDEYREIHPTHLPFAFRLLEGRMLVTAVDPSASPLAVGQEILAIDGTPLSELVDRIGAAMNIDGWTDHARASRLDTPYEFEDTGLEHYLPLFEGFRARFVLRVRALASSTESELEVPAVTLERAKALRPSAARDFPKGVSVRDLDERTALLTVETFVNYRTPVDPESVFAPLFRGFQERGIEHLVLDLRACGGGSGDVAWSLARFLAHEPFFDAARPPRVKRIRFGELVPHLSTWAEGAFEMPEEAFRRLEDGRYEVLGEQPVRIEPHSERFPGRITILIGPYNASGATMLLAVLREHAELCFVGQPTAGSAEGPTAGLLFFLALPASGIRVNLPVLDQRTSAIRFEPGMGVAPDVLVPETIPDVLAGIDAALAAALR